MRLTLGAIDDRSPAELSAYVDGELGFWRSHSVRAHLRGCAPCRRYVEQLEQAKALMGSVGSPTLSDEARGALRQAYAAWVRRPVDLEAGGRD